MKGGLVQLYMVYISYLAKYQHHVNMHLGIW